MTAFYKDICCWQDYIKYKSGSAKRTPGNGRESAVQEVTSGLREYFNVMLGSQLLYKFEREQHSDMIKQFPDTPMSKVRMPEQGPQQSRFQGENHKGTDLKRPS